MSLAPGTNLGPYRILTLLGKGGMGEVYRAEDPKLGREVAIKVLPEGFAEDRERLKRFEQEARAAGALNHPNLLTVHDLGTHEGSPYLVMELLEGQTFRTLMGQGALPVERVVDLAGQIAAGLAAAHERGIVHRDLKPENLFLTRDRVVKILDFGLAKQGPLGRQDSGAETLAGMVLGTASYMSPEQACGHPVDFRSDQFSLGVVLYEMLSGRQPFGGPSTTETLAAIVGGDPAPLVPSGPLAAVVARCLEKSPGKRYGSTKDLARQLGSLRRQASSGEGFPGVAAALGGRRRVRLALVGVSLAGVAVALGWAAWSPEPQRSPRNSNLVALPSKVVGPTESAFLADAIPHSLSALLAGVEGVDMKVPPTSYQVEKMHGDLGKIAEAYGVENLVVTSVTAQGERLILTVQLVETATLKVKWAGRFEGSRGAYQQLLEQAADSLIGFLKLSSATQDPRRIGGGPMEVEVELGLREGVFFQQRYARSKDPRDFDQALAAFRRAHALDPANAQLVAEIAGLFDSQHFITRDARAGAEAEQWVAQALALDPRCGRAWAVRSRIEVNRPKVDPAAVTAFAIKATHHAPTEARGFITLGSVAPTAGFQKAAGLRSVELNPLNPLGYSWAAMCLTMVGDAAEGVAVAERAARVESQQGFHTWILYFSLFHAGRYEEARKAYTEVQWQEASRLMRFLMDGDLDGGRRLGRQVHQDWRRADLGAMDWVNRAVFYVPLLVRLGLREEALWLLDQCANSGFPPFLDWLLVDPDLQKLRGDPRYARAVSAARDYAATFLAEAEAAKARGEFPRSLEPALAELRDLVKRTKAPPNAR
ncbi:protein kinase domain-containing protein [Geothrix oryzisoli]|uniref:protein kinase domain-containing protein n=1 Tax=Geothrix oryzisoli TaxID=2922721 RepID=UPI001FAD8958|nr:serine/threonine-protein kinase [Geothrix oryzisoli]